MTNRIVDALQLQPLVHEGTVDQGGYGAAPYVAYDGNTNYSYRPAGALKGLDGFTAGGWFQFASDGMLIGAWAGAPNCAWQLYVATGTVILQISDDGTAVTSVSAAAAAIDTWHFIVGRFTPSTVLDLFMNGVKYTEDTSIPANIYDASANFTIGGDSAGSNLVEGKASNCFFCSAVLLDAQISVLYETSRHLYGR